MNFSTVIKGCKMAIKYSGKQIVKHAPGILCGFGTGGVGLALWLMAKKAPEAKKELDAEKAQWEATEDKEKRNKADYIFKLVRIGAKHYWVVVSVATGAIVCFWLANRINFKRLMSALTALGISTKGKEEIEEKIKELDGEKHLRAVKDEIAKDQLKNAPPIDPNKNYGPGESWFYEPGSHQYIRTSYEKIRQAAENIRRDLREQILDGNRYAFVPVNDFILDIGGESCDFGKDLGFGIEIVNSNISEKKLVEMSEEACSISFASDWKENVPVGVIIYDCRLHHEEMYNVFSKC